MAMSLCLYLFFAFKATLLWLTPTTFDFGTIKQGKTVFTKFKFRNTGDAPLRIDNVRTGCDCTSPEWPEEDIAPGEVGYITVGLEAREIGYYNETITVWINKQRKPEKLTIEATSEE